MDQQQADRMEALLRAQYHATTALLEVMLTAVLSPSRAIQEERDRARTWYAASKPPKARKAVA